MGWSSLAGRLRLIGRASRQNSFLQTLYEINKLILRANEARTLLEQACHLLVTGRDYPLVWIGLVKDGEMTIQPCAQASALDKADKESPHFFRLGEAELGDNPIGQALHTGMMILSPDLARQAPIPGWELITQQPRLRSSALFPMRFTGRVIGILCVFLSKVNGFDDEELTLLQAMADDLAYALANLEVRQQQLLLQTSAANMRDGLMITDLQGNVIYANPVVSEILSVPFSEITNQDGLGLLDAELAGKIRNEYAPVLLKEGQVTLEFELLNRNKHRLYLSLHAVIAYDALNQPAHVVVNVRDITSRVMYEHQLVTLNRLTTELVQIHDLQTLLEKLLLSSEELLQANSSAILLVDPSSHHKMSEFYPHNLPEETITGIRQGLEKMLQGLDLIFTQAMCIEDSDEDQPSGEWRQLLRNNHLRAGILLPLVFQGQPLGVLSLYYRHPHRFSTQEHHIAVTVAQTLAIAFQNARLYQAEQNQRRMAEALAQASAALNSSLDLEQVLDRILEQIVRVVPCRTVNIMLVEGDSAYVVRYLEYPDTGEPFQLWRKATLPLSTPTLHQMMESGQPILIPNTLDSTLWMSLPETSWIRSYAGAPLQVREQILGFINLNSNRENFFTAETIEQLQAFTSTAASALQNARLYRDLRQHYQELENRVRERTSELSTAKERIERIMLSVPDAVFVLDENDRLVQTNPAGDSLMVQASHGGFDLFSDVFLERLKMSGIPNEKNILELEGRAYQAVASSLPFRGHQTGLVIVFRDVTRFRELDQMKTKFVSDVSHELRTPLTNVTIYLELLGQTKDEGKRARYLGTVQRETERLTLLIENLLTISRLETGRIPIKIHAIDVDQLVSELTNDRAHLAQSRGLTLKHVNAGKIPLAQADSRLLTQVLSNLLTNAINYTASPGEIVMRTDFAYSGRQPWVTIAVTDNGPGIRHEEIAHIFERFFRGSASQQSGAPGTGLGLAISKEIMDRMRGRISVESEPGRGSTFTVWLPIMIDESG